MADENTTNESTENTDHQSAENGVIINVNQLQSIDIPQRLNFVKTENGWIAHSLESGRVTVTFVTSMRKHETTLMEGDSIERDGDDLIILRTHPPDAYRSQRSSSILARTREELLSTDSTDE